MKISITKDSNCLLCLHDITALSLREKASIVGCFLYYNENRSVAGVLLSFNEPESLGSTSCNYCPGLKRLIALMMMMASGVCNTYRTMVLRNQGLFAMEGTASSIRGCILMKLSVSSGNSLDTLYLSIGGVPAQLPGLQMERRKRKATKRRDNERRKKKGKSTNEKPPL